MGLHVTVSDLEPYGLRHGPSPSSNGPAVHPLYGREIVVTVVVWDEDDPHIEIEFVYMFGPSPGELAGSWPLISFTMRPRGRTIPVLTVGGIRDASLARWERAARAHVGDKIVERAQHLREKTRDLPGLDVERLYPELRKSKQPADVRRYKSLRHLAAIARDYRSAQMAGYHDPAATLARDRKVKPATARTWIHRARKAGFLPEVQRNPRREISSDRSEET